MTCLLQIIWDQCPTQSPNGTRASSASKPCSKPTTLSRCALSLVRTSRMDLHNRIRLSLTARLMKVGSMPTAANCSNAALAAVPANDSGAKNRSANISQSVEDSSLPVLRFRVCSKTTCPSASRRTMAKSPEASPHSCCSRARAARARKAVFVPSNPATTSSVVITFVSVIPGSLRPWGRITSFKKDEKRMR